MRIFIEKFNYKIIASLFVLSLIILGFQPINDSKNDNELSEIQQDKDDLLSGVTRAISYSGFRLGQHPDRGNGAINPSYEETLEDLQILSKDNYFQLIRVYDCDENSQLILKVIKENDINIKVLLGMWLDAEISNHEGCPWLNEPIPADELAANKKSNLEEIEKGIELANAYPEIIVGVNVGNEMLVEWNDHMVEHDTVITYIRKVKSEIQQPVTVAENVNWWIHKGERLAKEIDFIGVHSYPLWEGQDINVGLSYTINNLKAVKKALPESKIVITEAGWATIAVEFGERASEEKQLRYYNELYVMAEKLNITTFFFEAFDEPWKGETDNADGAEKNWGIFNVDRTPKLVMQELYPELMKSK
jgi:exo-beta-1,3-glucanase (GH17 family)